MKTSQPFQEKLVSTGFRIKAIVQFFPVRAYRLFCRFRAFPISCKKAGGFGFWLAELVLLIFDLLGGPEWYETWMDWWKFNSRPLSEEELEVVQPYFGHSFHYNRIRIDEKASIGTQKGRICYVSFYHVNNWGKVPTALLVHELVHIRQFERYGSPYVLRALRAYHSKVGYDYGGIAGLRRMKKEGLGFWDLNFEQQADVIMDHFLISRGRQARWGNASSLDLPFYRAFTEEIRGKDSHFLCLNTV